jgi:predicted nuclease of predicted toxin-antitoxin system
MKIILDECLPRRLIRDLNAYSVTTVPRQGWAGLKDRELIEKSEAEFDVFVTVDANLIFQQNLQSTNLFIIIIHAANSRYEKLEPLVPDILRELKQSNPGRIVHVG